MNEALELSEVNRLHFLRKITEGERLRRVFEIREKFATRVGEQLELFSPTQEEYRRQQAIPLLPTSDTQEWFGS